MVCYSRLKPLMWVFVLHLLKIWIFINNITVLSTLFNPFPFPSKCYNDQMGACNSNKKPTLNINLTSSLTPVSNTHYLVRYSELKLRHGLEINNMMNDTCKYLKSTADTVKHDYVQRVWIPYEGMETIT